MVNEMSAKLYSLNAFKIARRREGLPAAMAAKFARHVATEMQEDGELAPGPAPSVSSAVKMLVEEMSPNLPEPEPAREVHPGVTDLGPRYNYEVGSKYEKGLDVAEIAKRLRAEVKAKIASGHWPKGLKVGVTVSRYSGGRSISMNVTASPWPMLNPAHVLAYAREPHVRHEGIARYTDFATALFKELEAMGTAYNYDRSDMQTDYYDTNFALHVDYWWETEKAEREAILAKAAV